MKKIQGQKRESMEERQKIYIDAYYEKSILRPETDCDSLPWSCPWYWDSDWEMPKTWKEIVKKAHADAIEDNPEIEKLIREAKIEEKTE